MRQLFTIPSSPQLKRRALTFPTMLKNLAKPNKKKNTNQNPFSHRHPPPLSPPHTLSEKPDMYFKTSTPDANFLESSWSMKEHMEQSSGGTFETSADGSNLRAELILPNINCRNQLSDDFTSLLGGLSDKKPLREINHSFALQLPSRTGKTTQATTSPNNPQHRQPFHAQTWDSPTEVSHLSVQQFGKAFTDADVVE